MALIALEKLEDQLNCSICLDTYTNPKQLQCHHVYCQQCLVKLVVRDKQGQLSLTCPNCRQVTPIPASGVAGLQSAFHVNQLLEIVEKHKESAVMSDSSEQASKKAEGTSESPTLLEKTSIVCHEHGRKEVELYCETCREIICWECIMKGGKHHSHDYNKLDLAFEQYRKELTSLLEPVEEQLQTIEKALNQLDLRCSEISDQQASLEASIHNRIARLHETLDARKTELISQLHQLTQAKLKGLAAQRDQLETTQAQLSSCLHFMKENLETGNQADALLMKSTTSRQVKELTTTFQPDMLEPNTKADMIFSVLKDLCTECQNYGNICTSSLPDPSKCSVTIEGRDAITVGEEICAVIQVFDSSNLPCNGSVTSILCEVLSEITGTRENNFLERQGQGYMIRCQPSIKGRHQLKVTVEGHHIRGSPCSLYVSAPVEQLGPPILIIDGVKGPKGVAINHFGEIILTECSQHCVTVFSPSGEKLRSFGTRGTGQGQFQYPRGIAVDGDDNILIVDTNNHRIQKFTAQGKFLKAVGSRGLGLLQFKYPRGIALSTYNSNIYIVDCENNYIQIFDSDFSCLKSFGGKGSGKGQFDHPRYIACDSTGSVYVTDRNNHRVQVFTAEGKFLRTFGGRESMNWPRGIAVDSSNRVYVADSCNHRISVFTSEGQLLSSFGSYGERQGQFKYPYGLVVDTSGVVYVSDKSNERVQVF